MTEKLIILLINQLSMNNIYQWTEIIEPKKSLFELRFIEVWKYRNLLRMWIKREIAANYKQTILGPIWFFLQPLFTTVIYIIVFGKFAGLSTNGLPGSLFYLAGVIIWNYFSESLTKTATVFKDNSQIFGKVYFPRLIMPLSIVLSNLVRFGIQFLLFIIVLLYYLLMNSKDVHPNIYLLLTPFLLIIMAGFALGGGMIISALTTKYRDLIFLLTFGIQLFMYATPVIYPVSSLSKEYLPFVWANPLSHVVEAFRFSFLGAGAFSWSGLGYSFLCMLVLLAVGVLIFNKVERSFMDTI